MNWIQLFKTKQNKTEQNKTEKIYNYFVTLMKETFKIQDKDMPLKDEVKKKINVIKAKYIKAMCVV